jgi:hypothetical protein
MLGVGRASVSVGDDVGDFAAGVGVGLGLLEVGAGHDAAGAGGPFLPGAGEGVGVEFGGAMRLTVMWRSPAWAPFLKVIHSAGVGR